MSVPMRDQSGASASSPIQLCKSVKPAENDWTITRQPKELTAAHLHLGHEEVVICGKIMGVVKFTVNSTSCPVIAPLPPVV